MGDLISMDGTNASDPFDWSECDAVRAEADKAVDSAYSARMTGYVFVSVNEGGASIVSSNFRVNDPNQALLLVAMLQKMSSDILRRLDMQIGSTP